MSKLLLFDNLFVDNTKITQSSLTLQCILENMSFARSAHLIIYYRYFEGLLSVLPSLVPFTHFTLVALLLLLPHGALVLPISLLISFLDSWIALFLSIHNTLLCTVLAPLLGRLMIFAHILMNALPCRGLVKKSPSISFVGQYAIFTSPFFFGQHKVIPYIEMSCALTA